MRKGLLLFRIEGTNRRSIETAYFSLIVHEDCEESISTDETC